MDTVIEKYNNTPNTALNGITPNEAHLKANQKIIFKINLLKQKGKQEESDLVIGDKVRNQSCNESQGGRARQRAGQATKTRARRLGERVVIRL